MSQEADETPPTPPQGGATREAQEGHLRDRADGLPEAGDLQDPRNRTIKAESWSQRSLIRRGRLEINPYWAFSLTDQFVDRPRPGHAVNTT